MASQIETRSFEARLPCRYLLQKPETGPGARTLIVLALHGYGSNPEDMLRFAALTLGGEHIIASLQAPFQHYAQPDFTKAAYNWGIRQHWEQSVCLHHDMVLTALDWLRGEFGMPVERCVLMGFSQPVGLNYRFVGTHPGRIGGLIGICGGVPRDWEEDKYSQVTAPILHIARDQDEFYPKEKALEFPARLGTHASDVEFHMLGGGHRFPSQAGPLVRDWIGRKWRL